MPGAVKVTGWSSLRVVGEEEFIRGTDSRAQDDQVGNGAGRVGTLGGHRSDAIPLPKRISWNV